VVLTSSILLAQRFVSRVAAAAGIIRKEQAIPEIITAARMQATAYKSEACFFMDDQPFQINTIE
jgi:hypothetical protein